VYRDAYTPKESKLVRAKPKDATLGPNRPFKGTTTHQDDYIWHEDRSHAQPIYQVTGTAVVTAPFNALSTQKTDFVPFPNAVRARPSLTRYGMAVKPRPDDRNFVSESAHSFNGAYCPPSKSLKPKPTPSGSTAPFNALSTHQSDFIPLDARPAATAKKQQYVICHPDEREFDTEHRAEFTPKESAHCPAIPVHVQTKAKSGHVELEPHPEREGWRHKDPAHTQLAAAGKRSIHASPFAVSRQQVAVPVAH